MRIIAGIYGSRIIKVPRGFASSPMGDRIKSALFNSLGDLQGKDIWDAFAGSGALAIESVSRGANYALATERDPKTYKAIVANVEKLGVQRMDVVKANCRAWSSTNPEKQFDIIFCDPPWSDFQLASVWATLKHLKPNGLMVLSYPGREDVPTANGVVVVDNRNYGDAALAFYRLE